MPGGILDDLAELSGAATPPRKSTRKETILSLVEALLQEGGKGGFADDPTEKPSFEDDRDVPSVTQKLQLEGAEVFGRFEKRIHALDKELRSFANASRQLGSSVGILSSAFHLRERLAQVLHVFRHNASDLFPNTVTVPKQAREPTLDQTFTRTIHKHRRHEHITRLTIPTINVELDVEDIPDQLEDFARDLVNFLNCLNEFPEFTDEGVNSSIRSFEADLKYWADCLEEYRGQFRYPAVQRYVHDLQVEIGAHLDGITSTLAMFIEIGVPTIRFAQKHGATNLLNLSTVATFFSAVTATTMQFSFEMIDTNIEHAVNGFWFASLVFSIGAAVNSLLGLTWKQAMYRSPGHRVPWWVLIWIKRSPLVFLVLSVACFSIGLCCFAYASNQHKVTSTLTTVLTAFTSFGLVAVSMWFATERWIFTRHRGKKWLDDVLDELLETFLNLPGVSTLHGWYHASGDWFDRAKAKVQQMRGVTSDAVTQFLRSIMLIWQRKPLNEADVERGSPHTPPTSPEIIQEGKSSDEIGASTTAIGSSVHHESKVRIASPSFSVRSLPEDRPATPPATPDMASEGKVLWQNALRRVRLRNTLSRPIQVAPPRRKRTVSSGARLDERSYTPVTMSKSRVAALQPKLNCLAALHDLPAHTALVRHLQFSPDGKFLATASWDRTAVIWNVGKQFTSHRVLAHAKGFVSQVAWSPAGNWLLTKVKHDIKIWTPDGVCKKTITRPRSIESLTWFPDGKAFISVEHSSAVKLSLDGEVLAEFEFDRINLHDVAVAMEDRLLGVGSLQKSKEGLTPSKANAEKRLVVYNMTTKSQENQTPVLNDVRDITIARNGFVALVSYENKAPPQLWKVEMVRDREAHTTTGRLTLRHTYMPKVPVDFAGPSYFGGAKDELVLCAGKSGDIHIWDTESGSLLHYVRAQLLGGDLTCIGWNHAAEDPFMFATGSHDGTVRIWTKPPDEEEELDIGLTSAMPTRPGSPSGYAMSRSESPERGSLHSSSTSLLLKEPLNAPPKTRGVP